METLKAYKKPEMEEYEIKAEGVLLSASCPLDGGSGGGDCDDCADE